jgi:ATP-dependent RNA helicase DeaD
MTENQPSPPAEQPAPPPTFDVLPLSAELRKAVDACGYTHPTPVQRAVFEPASRGKSLVVQARTGTGKTAAFGLPILDALIRKNTAKVQALILTPTRELALQVGNEIERLGQFRGIKITSIYGGAPMGKQIEALEGGAQIVVGTPGRVLDHLRRGTLDASNVRIFVLDEADEMLSMGFAKELHAIADKLPKDRQGLFFSATIPPDIERLAHAQLKDPEFITLSSDQVGALSVNHFVYVLRGGDKRQELIRIIEVEDPESAVVFCNTKDETQRMAEALQNKGYDADWLNGDLEQRERERVMTATREGKLRFLVATDVAARGIDISHLTHVINADFPETAEQYVHRTGRTGRAGRTGTAISIVGPKDIGSLYILRLTYKIRPIEKQLPSAGELKTRAEHDLVAFFAEAFASRPADPNDLGLARRLLTHPDAEKIVAGLMRDHLGAKEQGPGARDVAAEAAEARRAKNPPPVPAVEAAIDAALTPAAKPDVRPEARVERPRRTEPSREMGRDAGREAPRDPGRDQSRDQGRGQLGDAGRRGPRDRGPRDLREPRDERDTRDTNRGPVVARESAVEKVRDPRESYSFRDPREPVAAPGAVSPAAPGTGAVAASGPGAEGGMPRRPDAPPPRGRVPHKSYATWEPPVEHDDDKPIFAASGGPAGASTGGAVERPLPPPLPGITEGDAPVERASFTRIIPDRGSPDRAPREREPREPRERDADGPEDDPSFAQIFVNVGRRDGARAGDFQKLLADAGGIPPEETGRIRVRDRNTFVSVKKETLERALAALAGQVIAGRNVIAEPAKQRVP